MSALALDKSTFDEASKGWEEVVVVVVVVVGRDEDSRGGEWVGVAT